MGVLVHQWTPVAPVPLEDAAPMEDASSPPTQSNSTERFPDGAAEGAPPICRAGADNQVVVDIYQ